MTAHRNVTAVSVTVVHAPVVVVSTLSATAVSFCRSCRYHSFSLLRRFRARQRYSGSLLFE